MEQPAELRGRGNPRLHIRQGVLKDRGPSSRIFSHLWKLTLSWRQLGNQGEAIARSQVGSGFP